jgi:transcriptional repressor NrdR
MKCPFCKQDNDKVVDSRTSSGGFVIRRRRRCLHCQRRYTTYERVERATIRVVKKDGRREDFDGSKILAGLKKACEKRPVPTERLEQLATEIESQIYDSYDDEVPSSEIGKLVMAKLGELDKVAYVRFASVYREFKDVADFVNEVRPMLSTEGDTKKKAEGSEP